MKDSDGREVRCVASWLADPLDCWLRSDCRYWSRVEERCCYVEWHRAELERARSEGGVNGSTP